MKLVPYGKDPLHGYHFAKQDPESEKSHLPDTGSALEWIEKGGNIAVRLDDYVAFDIDTKPYPVKGNLDFYRRYNTLVQFTRRGYHVVFTNTNKLSREKVTRIFLTKYPNSGYGNNSRKDCLHMGNQYIALAPSKIKYPDNTISHRFLLDDAKQGINPL